jgi:hypothetical protein
MLCANADRVIETRIKLTLHHMHEAAIVVGQQGIVRITKDVRNGSGGNAAGPPPFFIRYLRRFKLSEAPRT